MNLSISSRLSIYWHIVAHKSFLDLSYFYGNSFNFFFISDFIHLGPLLFFFPLVKNLPSVQET